MTLWKTESETSKCSRSESIEFFMVLAITFVWWSSIDSMSIDEITDAIELSDISPPRVLIVSNN